MGKQKRESEVQYAGAIRLICIIALGMLSRLVPTGFALWDKYAGDALYAAMVYEILRLVWRPRGVALWAMGVMTAVEVFQLTGIPARMFTSGNPAVRIAARLLGTSFGWGDLLAYAVGIAAASAAPWGRRAGEAIRGQAPGKS